MTSSRIPAADPRLVAPKTWPTPNPAAAGPDRNLQANSLLVRGSEPIVVDTGAAVHRRRWLEAVASLVDPEDVRWIVLSHDSILAGDRGMRLYTESFALLNSLVPPRQQWPDPARSIGNAFERVPAMAAATRVPPPGQFALDELIVTTVVGHAVV